jgi:hypothetical protein
MQAQGQVAVRRKERGRSFSFFSFSMEMMVVAGQKKKTNLRVCFSPSNSLFRIRFFALMGAIEPGISKGVFMGGYMLVSRQKVAKKV